MSGFASEKTNDTVILVARVLLMLLFLIFGWSKLTGYSGTVAMMQQHALPFPALAAVISIIAEFFGALAIMLGIFTRPLALVMAVYTLATALLGHHFWTMTGGARIGNMINFYKNLSIVGGFLLLYVTGAGGYSLDAKLRRH